MQRRKSAGSGPDRQLRPMQLKTSRNQLKSALTCCITMFSNQFSHISSQCVTFTLNSHFVCCHVCSYVTELQHSQSTDWSKSDKSQVNACSVFCKSSAIAILSHTSQQYVSHFLAFHVLYSSVHVSLPVETAQNQTDLNSQLVLLLLCLQPATINQ